MSWTVLKTRPVRVTKNEGLPTGPAAFCFVALAKLRFGASRRVVSSVARGSSDSARCSACSAAPRCPGTSRALMTGASYASLARRAEWPAPGLLARRHGGVSLFGTVMSFGVGVAQPGAARTLVAQAGVYVV